MTHPTQPSGRIGVMVMDTDNQVRVLVIEDNLDNAKLITNTLMMHGFTAEVCERAETGIERAIETVPDIILMDISLPGMDGIDAAKVLKAHEKTSRIPVIAVTAHAMEGDRDRCMAAGFDGFLTKPIDVAMFGNHLSPFFAA